MRTGFSSTSSSTIATRTIANVLPPDQRELAEQLVRAAGAVELHVDARGDVAVVADVKGEDAQAVEELGKSLGGALALARMRAQSQGQEDVAKLLDFARVRPDGDAFRLEVALPIDVLKERLATAPPMGGRPGQQGRFSMPLKERAGGSGRASMWDIRPAPGCPRGGRGDGHPPPGGSYGLNNSAGVKLGS